MDKESLEVILEDLCDGLIKGSEEIIDVVGPILEKTEGNVHYYRIIFYANMEDLVINKEDTKLMELEYSFDLNKLDDETIFVNIGFSLIGARNKILKVLHSTGFVPFGSNPKDIDKQREYVR